MKKDPFGMKVPDTSAPGDIPANNTTAGAVVPQSQEYRIAQSTGRLNGRSAGSGGATMLRASSNTPPK